jgi:glycerol-3-phosphate acyltransferase PlsY
MMAKEVICIILAYLLGGICTGYYLVRFRTGKDVREQGSGGVGARNTGRVLGRLGFFSTLLGDAIKGALAVLLARQFGMTETLVSAVIVAVVAGHIWPLLLHFRGGRGIATAIGSYLAFDPKIALLLLGLTLTLVVVFRSHFILDGLAAFLLLPPTAYLFKMPLHAVVASAGVATLVLFAHRKHIGTAFTKTPFQKEA